MFLARIHLTHRGRVPIRDDDIGDVVIRVVVRTRRTADRPDPIVDPIPDQVDPTPVLTRDPLHDLIPLILEVDPGKFYVKINLLKFNCVMLFLDRSRSVEARVKEGEFASWCILST